MPEAETTGVLYKLNGDLYWAINGNVVVDSTYIIVVDSTYITPSSNESSLDIHHVSRFYSMFRDIENGGDIAKIWGYYSNRLAINNCSCVNADIIIDMQQGGNKLKEAMAAAEAAAKAAEKAKEAAATILQTFREIGLEKIILF